MRKLEYLVDVKTVFLQARMTPWDPDVYVVVTVFGALRAAGEEVFMNISCWKDLCQAQPAHLCNVFVGVKLFTYSMLIN